MENFGKIKAIQSNKYFNSSSAKSISKFIEAIKNSTKLQNEFKIYKSLEKAYIPNPMLAMKHIDRNVSKRGILSESELEKIQEFNEQISIDEKKQALYESIHTLLHSEDVDKQHDAYVVVLEHIQNNKPEVLNEDVIKLPDNIDREVILEFAVNKFNDKYKVLDEEQRRLFSILTTSTLESKQSIFETLKKETIELTNEGNNNGIEDKINEAIDSINKLLSDSESINTSIIKLVNYKQHLLS
jgi:hypothetical protein